MMYPYMTLADETEIVIDGIDNLDKDAKQQLLKKLAKELGVEISVTTNYLKPNGKRL